MPVPNVPYSCLYKTVSKKVPGVYRAWYNFERAKKITGIYKEMIYSFILILTVAKYEV
jgi:hypothetical protein